MKKIKLLVLCGIGLLFMNITFNASVAIEEGPDDGNSSTHLQGEFAGNYYYYLDWYNGSTPGWDYYDDFTYWEILWLNNGTEDTWVMVVVDYDLHIEDSGELSYLYFEIYDDPDGSFLSNYEDDWDEFEAIEWEDYDDYYVDENAEAWGWDVNNTDPVDINGTEVGPEEPWDDGEFIDGDEVPGDVGYAEEYNTMEDSLTGDEGLWFIDVYFEEWTTTYNGTITYTWYNMEYTEDWEIIMGSLLDPSNLGPALTYPYETSDPSDDDPLNDGDGEYWFYDWGWDWAQMMLTNETYDDESYSWTWFSYNIGQWVSHYDNVTNQYSFLSQNIGYIGMSLFEDTNGNGVVDVSYDNIGDVREEEVWILPEMDEPIESPMYEINISESEEKYLLNLESVGDVSWGIPEITDSTAEFWVCLEDVNFLAVPYASNYNWFMGDSIEDGISIASNVDYLNVSFSFEGGETGSSIAVKHDIADFTDTTENQDPIAAFENLSMTIDYTVYSDSYSEVLSYDASDPDEPFWTEDLNSAVAFDGEVAVEQQNDEFMNMDFSMSYIWGKNGQEYENTVAINPLWGYQTMYSTAEVGQASTFGYESSSYMYSMCFNWEGYAITMDPTFVSFYRDINSDGFPSIRAGSIVFSSVVASVGLVMIFGKKRKHI
ncbi:MAG: hypothetical protein ACTSVZ_02010 [Promethearchaeota archaeon]